MKRWHLNWDQEAEEVWGGEGGTRLSRQGNLKKDSEEARRIGGTKRPEYVRRLEL